MVISIRAVQRKEHGMQVKKFLTWNNVFVLIIFIFLFTSTVIEVLSGDLLSIGFALALFVLFLFALRFRFAWVLFALAWLAQSILEANIVGAVLSIILLFINTIGYVTIEVKIEDKDTIEDDDR